MLKKHPSLWSAEFITTLSMRVIPPILRVFFLKYPLEYALFLLPSVEIDNKTFGLGQAKSFVASCIIRPIGKFRGHDRSASLKSI
jgi:hypothetical protein